MMLKNIEQDAACPLAYVWNTKYVGEDGNLSEGFGEWGTIAIVKGEGGLCRNLSFG